MQALNHAYSVAFIAAGRWAIWIRENFEEI